jgi:hypothetical protein
MATILDLDRVSTLFSRLLAECMDDQDVVRLHIPESLDGKLHYLGSGLRHGTLVILGNAGNFAATKWPA